MNAQTALNNLKQAIMEATTVAAMLEQNGVGMVVNDQLLKPEPANLFDGWVPKEGDDMYVIQPGNQAGVWKTTNDQSTNDKLVIKQRCVFRTKGQAAAVASAIFVLIQLRNQPGAFCGNTGGWIAGLTPFGKLVSVRFTANAHQFTCPTFPTEKFLAQALDAVGRDRVEKALRVWAMLPVSSVTE